MKLLAFLLLLISSCASVIGVYPDDHVIGMQETKEPCMVALCVSKNPAKIEHAQDMQWGYRIALLALCFFIPGTIEQINPDSTVYELFSGVAFAAIPPAALISDFVWYGIKKCCYLDND